MATKTDVKIDRVSLKMGTTWILKEASMQIDEGSIFALCGPSGCGKSTMCQAILGLKHISSGCITFQNGPRKKFGAYFHVNGNDGVSPP